MTRLDVEAIRAQVRALDFGRGSSAEIAMWREGDAESRVNLAIEGMALEPDDEDALFDMLGEEAVPRALAAAIVLKLLGAGDDYGGKVIGNGMAPPARPRDPQPCPPIAPESDLGDHGADPQLDRARPPPVPGRDPVLIVASCSLAGRSSCCTRCSAWRAIPISTRSS